MKTIEQKLAGEIKVFELIVDKGLKLEQEGDIIFVDKQGAAELIKVLQERVSENN